MGPIRVTVRADNLALNYLLFNLFETLVSSALSDREALITKMVELHNPIRKTSTTILTRPSLGLDDELTNELLSLSVSSKILLLVSKVISTTLATLTARAQPVSTLLPDVKCRYRFTDATQRADFSRIGHDGTITVVEANYNISLLPGFAARRDTSTPIRHGSPDVDPTVVQT